MDQPSLMSTKQFVRELADGQAVDSVFVVREQARRQRKNGDTFLKLKLADRSGELEAVVWDGVDDCLECTRTGEVVRVAGPYSVDQRYGATLTVRAVRAAAPEEYDAGDLREVSPIPLEQMLSDLDDLIGTVQQPHLRQLLDTLLGPESRTGRSWRLAPAAKRYHQAYRHGLLEHCLSVAQGVSAMAALFPGIDRDVAVTGALLHDIGKIEAYALVGESYDLTDAGRLEGEIPLGYYRVRRAIESIDGFPAGTAQAVVHIILAHHGRLEHGSPVTPCTREATLVHMIDNLGGTLGSFDRIERTLADGESWSGFDRALSGSAYFGPREQDAEQRTQAA
jgi:3'-5' exoribonuclease